MKNPPAKADPKYWFISQTSETSLQENSNASFFPAGNPEMKDKNIIAEIATISPTNCKITYTRGEEITSSNNVIEITDGCDLTDHGPAKWQILKRNGFCFPELRKVLSSLLF